MILFSQKVENLLSEIGANCTDIARSAGCDRSNISRLKNGRRVPEPSSSTIYRFLTGVYLYAEKTGKLEKLFSVIGYSGAAEERAVREKMVCWLYGDGKTGTNRRHGRIGKADAGSSFGERLSSVMKLTGISNVWLARQLHIDASAVSRFRTGVRSPLHNSSLMDDLCSVLFYQIVNGGHTAEFLKFVGLPENTDGGDMYSSFCKWMLEPEGENEKIVEQIIKKISSFKEEKDQDMPPVTGKLLSGLKKPAKPVYYGNDGIRIAGLRMLSEALQNGAKEFFIYSDQEMNWITEDKSFYTVWASYMRRCVSSGVRLIVIHNVNRSLDEMIAGINIWLPLYMSGMVESYYCPKPNNRRFSHTMYVIPGISSLTCTKVCAQSGEFIYRYDKDEKLVSIYEDEIKAIIKMSKRLMNVYVAPENKYPKTQEVTMIGNTLPLASMPEKTLYAIMDRCKVSEDERLEIIEEWADKRRFFFRCLGNGYANDCITRPQVMFDKYGQIPVALRRLKLFYTPEEYEEHMRNLEKISEKYPNYRYYGLQEPIFENISIMISPEAVAATRTIRPYITFSISHRALCNAFIDYADNLKKKYSKDEYSIRCILDSMMNK